MSTDPKKDVIYVDIEDDITSVIDKVKTAKTSIVALVPPKRVGVLQSVVNLKLLQRAAGSVKKRVVLITNDQALTGLAAGLSIPVAKNLQSRPEVPSSVPKPSEQEEIINGEELPVGELAKTADEPIDLSGMPEPTNEPGAVTAAPAAAAPFAAKAAAKAPKKGSKIPDFDTFRKKLFIIGGVGVLFLVFFVWAIFFAAKATVAVTAKTNIVNINQALKLEEGAMLDTAKATAPAVVKETKKTATVEFTATGKKDVGEKSTGTVKFSTEKISNLGTTIPAGTRLVSSSGLSFATTSDVTITISNYQGANTGVSALESGSRYNGAEGQMSGAPSGISATLTGATGGGTDKTITVVSASDVDKATDKLQTGESNKIRDELKKQFDKTIVVINESFAVEHADPTSSPAVGQEASSATLSAETTYRLIGVKRSDLRAVFDAYTKTQVAGEKNQKIYESGDQDAKFSEYTRKDKAHNVRVQTVAQVGPNIDASALAKQLTGKRSGEIQQQIETIQGVEDVNVKLSPFWVTKAPDNPKKISIKFVVKHD